jgi:hypothetical protein
VSYSINNKQQTYAVNEQFYVNMFGVYELNNLIQLPLPPGTASKQVTHFADDNSVDEGKQIRVFGEINTHSTGNKTTTTTIASN